MTETEKRQLSDIQQRMFVIMANINYDFGLVHQVNVRCCQFSVKFTDFGHIHSVIFIRST